MSAQRTLCFLIAGITAVSVLSLTKAQAWTFKTIHSFCAAQDCTDGDVPVGKLVIDSSGNLFGITDLGGDENRGTIFELHRSADGQKWRFERIYSFCAVQNCLDGQDPDASLIIDAKANLYGTTVYGGKHDNGVVFELVRKTGGAWKLKILDHFCAQACYHPNSNLTYLGAETGAPYDGMAPLYGTIFDNPSKPGGYGQVYSLLATDKKRRQLSVIYNFCRKDPNCLGGDLPDSRMKPDGNGNLLGATTYGGANNAGVLFRLVPQAGKPHWKEQALYSFCALPQCTDGVGPDGDVLVDQMGNIVGVASIGGEPCDDSGCGTVFRVAPDGTESTLYTFCSQMDCVDGRNPGGGLVGDSDGKLFGTTFYGGGNDVDPFGLGGGTVFQLNGTQQVLHSFCSEPKCADGYLPNGALVMDNSGNLFGVTGGGGKYQSNAGTVFELSP